MVPVGGNHEGPPRDTSHWSVGQLDAFWADFLQTEALERNDRVTHNNPRALGDHEARTGLDTTEAIVLGKRASAERDSDGLEPDKAKRPRDQKWAPQLLDHQFR